MTDNETEYYRLQAEMAILCAMRSARLMAAQAEIEQANRDFDREALPLGRRISALQKTLPKTPTVDKSDKPSHDPDWLQEDIDHFYELLSRSN